MRLRTRWIAALALAAFVTITPAEGAARASTRPAGKALPQLSYEGRYLINPAGQVVEVHGFNLVAKTPPYEPGADGFGAQDAAFLAAHGFNAVRLGVILEGLEPEPGTFDAAYLKSIKSTVNLLGRYGIYSLIDFHQDMYNEAFQGEGLPSWMIDDDGLPAEPQAGFPGNYFGMPALNRAFDNFWANVQGPDNEGLQNWYAAAWAHVATALSGNDNVLGYDLMNEPWPGSVWASCFPPAGCPSFDEGALTSFYRVVTTAIRGVDQSHLIFYEPLLTFDYSAPTYLGDLDEPNTGFNFHVYCLAALGAPETPPTRATCDQVESTTVDNALSQATASPGPLLLSEFGATNDTTELRNVADLADAASIPWLDWAFCECGDPTGSSTEGLVYNAEEPPTGSNVDTAILDALDEPYPQLVGGTPEGYAFDPTTDSFTFTYSTLTPSGAASGSPTVVYVPPLQYPQGYSVAADGATVSSRTGSSHLQLEANPGATTVTVTVTPAS